MSLRQRIINGTLSRESLANQKDKINEWDHKGYTPLALAVVRGDIELVELLIENEADVNARCKEGETALCFAAQKTGGSNRTAIIQCLLEAEADVDATCPALRGNTPLMLAIEEFPDDLDSIKLLRQHKASLTITNNDGKTAIYIARVTSPRVLSLLEERNLMSDFGDIVRMIVLFLISIIAYVDKALGGLIGRLFGFNRPVDDEFSQHVNGDEQVSVEEFRDNLNQTVNELGFDKFFSKDSKLLQTIAEKAVQLKDNPDTDLGRPHNIGNLTKLSMYQPVIFCDDSGSMGLDDRFQNQAKLVERICRITTYLVPDDCGIVVRFINEDDSDSNMLREKEVNELMSALEPGGSTELGFRLKKKILTPFLYDKVERDQDFSRPLLISIITDGHPEGINERNRLFIDVLKECSMFLSDHGYPQTAVRFQISQVGSETKVKDFFNDLKSEAQIQDMIYCTSDQLDQKYVDMKDNEKGLEEWLLTTLMEPITQGMALLSQND